MDRRAWQATVHGVAKSWTWVRWFSTHSRISLLGVACAVGSSLHCICYPSLLCGRQNGCKRLLSHLESTNWNEEKWNDSWDRIRVGLSACRTLKQTDNFKPHFHWPYLLSSPRAMPGRRSYYAEQDSDDQKINEH